MTNVARQNHDLQDATRLVKDQWTDVIKSVKNLSTHRFAYLSGSEDLKIDLSARTFDALAKTHQAAVILAGADVSLTYRAHFTFKELPTLFKRFIDKENRREIVTDLMSEYVNLIGGALAKKLHNAGIVCGVSLPIITTDQKKTLIPEVDGTEQIQECWKIVAEGIEFICTLTAVLATDSTD